MTDNPPASETAVIISPQEASALIDVILDRYHVVHRAELLGLIRLARQVQAAHPDAPQDLLPLLERMRTNLNRVHFENRGYVSPRSGNARSWCLRSELPDYGFQSGRGLVPLHSDFDRLPRSLCCT